MFTFRRVSRASTTDQGRLHGPSRRVLFRVLHACTTFYTCRSKYTPAFVGTRVHMYTSRKASTQIWRVVYELVHVYVYVHVHVYVFVYIHVYCVPCTVYRVLVFRFDFEMKASSMSLWLMQHYRSVMLLESKLDTLVCRSQSFFGEPLLGVEAAEAAAAAAGTGFF